MRLRQYVQIFAIIFLVGGAYLLGSYGGQQSVLIEDVPLGVVESNDGVGIQDEVTPRSPKLEKIAEQSGFRDESFEIDLENQGDSQVNSLADTNVVSSITNKLWGCDYKAIQDYYEQQMTSTEMISKLKEYPYVSFDQVPIRLVEMVLLDEEKISACGVVVRLHPEVEGDGFGDNQAEPFIFYNEVLDALGGKKGTDENSWTSELGEVTLTTQVAGGPTGDALGSIVYDDENKTVRIITAMRNSSIGFNLPRYEYEEDDYCPCSADIEVFISDEIPIVDLEEYVDKLQQLLSGKEGGG